LIRYSYKILSILVGLSLLLTCANERAITGGPADVIAPEITYSSPKNEAVNVGSSARVTIKFNEQMKQASLKSALQIWPNPPGGYEIKTGWTWIKVRFNQDLAANETYLLTLDKSAQDLRGNELESTYVLAFSTGDSLNSGRIEGSIYGDKNIRKNGNLLLYRQFDLPLSELRQQPADYVFQPDDDGNFKLDYLAEQSYLLYYHWDRNHNKRLDGDDYFGRPMIATVQARSDTLGSRHHIWPQVLPLPRVKLLELGELGEQFIQIRTARPWTKKSMNSFELFSEHQPIPVLGASKVAEDDFALHVDVADPIPNSAEVWIQNFIDTSGYSLNSDTLRFVRPEKFDTLTVSPFAIEWKNSSEAKLISDSSAMVIKGRLPFKFRSDTGFQLFGSEADSVSILGSLKRLTTMSWEFIPTENLKDGKTYIWQIDTDSIESPLNGFELDSLLKGKLSSVSRDSLGSVRVMQMGFEDMECSLVSKGVKRNFLLKPGIAALIKDLPAQKYSLVAYVDKDKNGRYSGGGMEIESGSEPFWVYPEEIKVRARWETDLGLWRYKE